MTILFQYKNLRLTPIQVISPYRLGLDIKGLPAGVYFIEMQNGEQHLTGQFVVAE